MKFIVAFLSLLSVYTVAHAQTDNQAIDKIRSQFKWINEQQDFKIITLKSENTMEEFSEATNGELTGYFKNDTLFKIVAWQESSYAVLVTEYYLWDTELFFVYDVEKNYKQIIDATDGFIGFDYTTTELTYESRHYYKNGLEIKRLENGARLFKADKSLDFVVNVADLKTLFENEKK